MKMPHITVTLQSVRYAGQRRPVGDIRVGLHTLSARERVQTAGIPVPTVFRTERVPSAIIPVHTVIRKRYIPMKMF